MNKQKTKKILVAMSGGVDSSVAALLLKNQLSKNHPQESHTQDLDFQKSYSQESHTQNLDFQKSYPQESHPQESHKQEYEVVGATMKLWGGPQDTGCCSVSDVDDARRVADVLDIPHFVFNFGKDFESAVVDPYIESYKTGETPNPCIECNRHIKFDIFLRRAKALGFDAIATGHHARIVRAGQISWLARGADLSKDQSYVLHPLINAFNVPNGSNVADSSNGSNISNASDNVSVSSNGANGDASNGVTFNRVSNDMSSNSMAGGCDSFYKSEDSQKLGDPNKASADEAGLIDAETGVEIMFPIGHLTKDEVRSIAEENNLRIAKKRDSYGVCFVQKADGREKFISDKVAPTPARVLDSDGEEIGEVPALELLTVGQRKGMGDLQAGRSQHQIQPRYVLSINPSEAKVVVGKRNDLMVECQEVRDFQFCNMPPNFNLGIFDLGAIQSVFDGSKNLNNSSESKSQNKSESNRCESEPRKISVVAQTNAHGVPKSAELVFPPSFSANGKSQNKKNEKSQNPKLVWEAPQKRVAPGQSIVFYVAVKTDTGVEEEVVLASCIAD